MKKPLAILLLLFSFVSAQETIAVADDTSKWWKVSLYNILWNDTTESWGDTSNITIRTYNEADSLVISGVQFKIEGVFLMESRQVMIFNDSNLRVEDRYEHLIDGKWTPNETRKYFYDESNRRTELIIYRWGNNGTSYTAYKTVYSYSSEGNLDESTAYVLNSEGVWVLQYRSLYTYDSQNNLTEKIEQTYDENNEVYVNQTRRVYVYDESNRLITYSSDSNSSNGWWYGQRNSYSYNDEGYLSQVITEAENSSTNEMDYINSQLDKYFYDEKGNRIEQINYKWENSKWSKQSRIAMSYNDLNRLTESIFQDWRLKPFETDSTWFNDYKYSYSYEALSKINSAPTALFIETPNDGYGIYIDDQSLADSLTFAWSKANDSDGDTVRYSFVGTGVLSFLSASIDTNRSLKVAFSDIYNAIDQSGLSHWTLPSDTTGTWTVNASDGLVAVSASNGSFTLSVVENVLSIFIDNNIPSEFVLRPNYPNPFNPTTTILYDLPEAAMVHLVIYDVLGRQVRTLVNQDLTAGYHKAVWDATDDLGRPLSGGLYIYRIQAGGFSKTMKMVLLK